jgi:hypothetical protein
MEQDQPSAPPPEEETIFSDQDFSMEGYEKHIKNARITLFVIAGLMLVNIFLMPEMTDLARAITIGLFVGISGIFAVLAWWTKKKPFTALLIALILYGVLLLGDALVDPSSIIKGIVVKVIVIILLIRGLQNGKEAQDMMNTFGKRS